VPSADAVAAEEVPIQEPDDDAAIPAPTGFPPMVIPLPADDNQIAVIEQGIQSVLDEFHGTLHALYKIMLLHGDAVVPPNAVQDQHQAWWFESLKHCVATWRVVSMMLGLRLLHFRQLAPAIEGLKSKLEVAAANKRPALAAAIQSKERDLQLLTEALPLLEQQKIESQETFAQLELLDQLRRELEDDPAFVAESLSCIEQQLVGLSEFCGRAQTWDQLSKHLNGEHTDDRIPILFFSNLDLSVAVFDSDAIMVDLNVESFLLGRFCRFVNQTTIKLGEESITTVWKDGAHSAASDVVEKILATALAAANRQTVQINSAVDGNKAGLLALSPQVLARLSLTEIRFLQCRFTDVQQTALVGAARVVRIEDCELERDGLPLAHAICGDTRMLELILCGKCELQNEAIVELLNNLDDALSPSTLSFRSGALTDLIRNVTNHERAGKIFGQEAVQGLLARVQGLQCWQFDFAESDDAEKHEFQFFLFAMFKRALLAKRNAKDFDAFKSRIVDELEEPAWPFSILPNVWPSLATFLSAKIKELQFQQTPLQAETVPPPLPLSQHSQADQPSAIDIPAAVPREAEEPMNADTDSQESVGTAAPRPRLVKGARVRVIKALDPNNGKIGTFKGGSWVKFEDGSKAKQYAHEYLKSV